jgi:C4-dicarboxylate transporter DctM subunit
MAEPLEASGAATVPAAEALAARFSKSTRRVPVGTGFGVATVAGAALTAAWGWAGAIPAIFLGMALLGAPLFVTLGLLAVLAFGLVSGFGFGSDTGGGIQVFLGMVEITSSPVLLAIPLFTLAGAVMTRGGISGRLVRVMKAALGWMPGGLAVATIAACAFFAALSGSSAVTIIAIGGMLAPTLERDYGKPFALGLVTSCGAIGILAPPSLPLIIYGVLASNASPGSPVDIQKLFVAGMIPGLLTVLLMAAYCSVRGFLGKAPRQAFDARELWEASRDGVWALLLPILLLGGIYGGVVTAAEASVLAVVYAVVVEVFVHRDVPLPDLPRIASDTMMLVGSILIILLTALGLSSFLTYEQIPDAATRAIGSFVTTKVGFLIAVNVLLLIVGCLMDIFSAIVVLTPLLVPMAVAYEVNLLHLGIVMVVNLEIGFVTPPFGINLFISSAFFRRRVGEVFQAAAPFIVVLLAALALVTWWEGASVWLVGKSGI